MHKIKVLALVLRFVDHQDRKRSRVVRYAFFHQKGKCEYVVKLWREHLEQGKDVALRICYKWSGEAFEGMFAEGWRGLNQKERQELGIEEVS